MSGTELFVAVIKIAIVLGFLLNMAAITTWADRRQSAMIQDRVGPNRAVIYLPAWLVRAVVLGGGVLVAAAIAVPFWAKHPGLESARITTGIEIAILVVWTTLLLISARVRKDSDGVAPYRDGADSAFEERVAQLAPRTYFYAGLIAQLAALFFAQLAPAGFIVRGSSFGPGVAGSLAALAILLAAGYSAGRVGEDPVPLRLAGMLHALADAVKLIWKEDLRPRGADRLLFALAPMLAMFPALVTMAVVPFGSTLCFIDFDRDKVLSFADLAHLAPVVGPSGACSAGQLAVSLSIANLDVGLLYVFAIAGTGVIGAAIAGWASNNKWALLGGLRATSQMVSYEVALGLSIVGMFMVAGTVNLQKLVDWQGQNAWGIFVQPLAFVLFLVALVAETKRVPFDQPEGESEIIAGYFLEYSGMKFGMFYTGEYIEFVFSSVLLVTLFFGGYHLPFLDPDGLRITLGSDLIYELKLTHLAVSAIHIATFFGKTILMVWLQLFIRWTLPRFRYDQLMRLGWTRLLPLALLNIVLTGAAVLALESAGEPLGNAVAIAADISQSLVALAALGGSVLFVTGLLEPSRTKRITASSAAQMALAEGGIRAGKMQA
ncbi:MAG: NADH-quinone oxidoreductase subunit H [Myxococcales bacterium]|nr:NADH-quinone oxidoreductase subunit H [Myxococcales bacterium]